MKSVRHTICRECGGKRGFISEHDAQKALGRAQSKRSRERGAAIENRYYEGDCGLFHLTAQSRKSYNGLAYAG